MKVIDIDTTSLMPKETLPFDQPFTLRIQVNSKSISFAHLVKHFGNQDLKESIIVRNANGEKEYVTFPKQNLRFETNDKKRTSY